MAKPGLQHEIDDALVLAAQKLIAAKRKSVLLVEDTASHAALILRSLGEDVWNIEHVTRASDALDSFSSDPTRIVILDLSLPDSDGLKLLGRLRTFNPDVMVIVVTASDKLQVSIKAMQKGACDYVLKSDPSQTGLEIKTAVERAWRKQIQTAESHLIEQSRLAELLRSERLETIQNIVRSVCKEVNNPLSGILALSQLLEEQTEIDSDLQRLASGIFNSAKEVADVVNKLNEVTADSLQTKLDNTELPESISAESVSVLE